MNALILYLMIALTLLFPAFLCVYCHWHAARASGWSRLAARYRSPRMTKGRLFDPDTFRMGGREYQAVAMVSITPEGLHLRLLPAYSLLHPPLLIPWTRVWPIHTGLGYELVLDADEPVRLQLAKQALYEVQRYIEFHSPRRRPAA